MEIGDPLGPQLSQAHRLAARLHRRPSRALSVWLLPPPGPLPQKRISFSLNTNIDLCLFLKKKERKRKTDKGNENCSTELSAMYVLTPCPHPAGAKKQHSGHKVLVLTSQTKKPGLVSPCPKSSFCTPPLLAEKNSGKETVILVSDYDPVCWFF